jgi:hypothetical protein
VSTKDLNATGNATIGGVSVVTSITVGDNVDIGDNLSIGGTLKAPFFVQRGKVSVTLVASQNYHDVSFDFPAQFPGTPTVIVTAENQLTNRLWAVVLDNVSNIGVTIRVENADILTANPYVYWIAIYTP